MVKERLLTWPTQMILSSILLKLTWAICTEEKLLSKQVVLYTAPVVTLTLHWSWLHNTASWKSFIASQYLAVILIFLALKTSLFFNWFQRQVVWTVSSCYSINECLSAWPTQNTVHRYMFQRDVAKWKQRMCCRNICVALNSTKPYVVTAMTVAAQSGKM